MHCAFIHTIALDLTFPHYTVVSICPQMLTAAVAACFCDQHFGMVLVQCISSFCWVKTGVQLLLLNNTMKCFLTYCSGCAVPSFCSHSPVCFCSFCCVIYIVDGPVQCTFPSWKCHSGLGPQ